METINDKKHVVVIGCGLVGTLAAIFMARRGYNVEVYEKREDMRKIKVAQGRSINLSISNRARISLREVGLEKEVLKAAVPMKGRLLHGLKGETKSVIYDSANGQCLYSISRNYLNELLMTALESYNVKINFNHKIIAVHMDDGEITIQQLHTKLIIKKHPDFTIAADGAYSTTRSYIQKSCLLSFSQTYIEHGYLELSINKIEGKLMIPNHLHIWPRGTFMMIALPNLDYSWTVTIFMPFKIFESLNESDTMIQFFKSTFPDYFNFTTKENLIKDFYGKKPLPLVSIKCSPYNFGKKFLLIGDAAHAMVPFYGQGLNAGFEDCIILNQLLDQNNDNISEAIELFSKLRKDDAHAICDLAMYNYVEMRDLVTKSSYNYRKKLDDVMFKLFPKFWIPLYNSVTFSGMGYQDCMKNRKWQDGVLQKLYLVVIGFLLIMFSYYIYALVYAFY